MAESFFTILTDLGQAELAAALQDPLNVKVELENFSVGNGLNDAYYDPISSQTALQNELYKTSVLNLEIDPLNNTRINVYCVVPTDHSDNWVGTGPDATPKGFFVREVGIWSSTGDLFAIAKVQETYKPMIEDGSGTDLTIKVTLDVTNPQVITLEADPTVVTASKYYVDEAVKKLQVFNVTDGQINQSVQQWELVYFSASGIGGTGKWEKFIANGSINMDEVAYIGFLDKLNKRVIIKGEVEFPWIFGGQVNGTTINLSVGRTYVASRLQSGRMQLFEFQPDDPATDDVFLQKIIIGQAISTTKIFVNTEQLHHNKNLHHSGKMFVDDSFYLKDIDGSPVGDIKLKCANQQLLIRNKEDSAYEKLHPSCYDKGLTTVNVTSFNRQTVHNGLISGSQLYFGTPTTWSKTIQTGISNNNRYMFYKYGLPAVYSGDNDDDYRVYVSRIEFRSKGTANSAVAYFHRYAAGCDGSCNQYIYWLCFRHYY